MASTGCGSPWSAPACWPTGTRRCSSPSCCWSAWSAWWRRYGPSPEQEGTEMAMHTREDLTEATGSPQHPRPSLIWMAQVVSGVLLLVLMTVHMVAQHFVAEGGLRTYADVVAWIGNPVVFTAEALLLVTVTVHAIAGIHA